MANETLKSAKKNKNDEFYTQLCDIEKELSHYKEHFKGKTVLCNCDDPRVSNFFRFFALKFNEWGIKRLITTCYKNQDVDLFSQNTSEKAVWLDYYGNPNDETCTDFSTVEVKHLKGDGDFRSKECIELLKEADIVVTNPPFSLFREFLAWIVEAEKQFLIIGNMNAITYKETFPLIKENKTWLGATGFVTDMVFGVPKGTVVKDSDKAKAARLGYVGDYTRLGNSCWFTNIDHGRRHQPLPLMTMSDNLKFSRHKDIRESGRYERYDNYDAIEVSYTDAIPNDYDGVMGVPISFLDKYCPEQFEILGMCENEDLYKLKTKVYTSQECRDAYWEKFGKKGTYDLNASGVVIRDGLREKVYQRILIKKQQ